MSLTAPVRAADIALASDTPYSAEGYFVISLTSDAPEGATATLEQSMADDFSDSHDYILPANGQITITGLPNGQYYFRASLAGSAYSETVMVEVMHHSMQRAVGFFLVGLALFLILIVTIVRGNRRTLEADHAS